MNLSDTERRFVRRWEKYQRWWPWTRWFCLTGSVVLIVAWAVLLHRLISLPLDSSRDAAAMAWFAPMCWMCQFMSSAWLGITLAHWRGDLKTRLLLTLISHHDRPDT
jgi:hypothetical protein